MAALCRLLRVSDWRGTACSEEFGIWLKKEIDLLQHLCAALQRPRKETARERFIASTCNENGVADIMQPGQRSKDSPHLLQGQGLQEAHQPQGDAVQGWQGMEYRVQLRSCALLILLQGLALRTGKAQIRPQAVRLRWSDEACVPQEGKDYEEGCPAVRVHTMQDQGTAGAEALQALRARVRRAPF